MVIQMNYKIERLLESEQFYLGSIIQDGSLLDESRLNDRQFIKGEHRSIFKAMKNLREREKEVNLINLVQMGEQDLESFGGISYLNGIFSSVPSINAFTSYERYILEYNITQEAMKYANEFIASARDRNDLQDLSKLIHKINKLESINISKNENFKEKIKKRYEQHIESPEDGLSGADTGFETINKFTDGWQKGDLIIIGARPSMGKTALILNSALKGSEKGVFPSIFSIEMAEAQIIDRMIAITARINLMKMRNPNKLFDKRGEDWEKYTHAVGALDKLDMDIRKENTVAEMRSVVRRNIQQFPNKKHVVIIDFLTLVRSTEKKQSRHHEVEDIILDLKNLATDLNVPVIVLSQLSREVEKRQNKRPMMSDLRESGSIEQTADVIAFLYRADYYNNDTEVKNIVEIDFAKNRNGIIGVIELAFIREYNLFTDLRRV